MDGYPNISLECNTTGIGAPWLIRIDRYGRAWEGGAATLFEALAIAHQQYVALHTAHIVETENHVLRMKERQR